MSILSIDFETRSTVDLKKAGVYVYAEDASTDIWCMAWAFDDEEPEIWRPYYLASETEKERYFNISPLADRILEHIRSGGEIRAWNAQFERIIWREIMVKRYGAPPIALEQFVCSAAEAAAMALPRSLGAAATVLGVEQQKDDKGARLMLQMARPRKVNPDGSVTWWDVPEKRAILERYCVQDVRTERAISKALRRLTPRERDVYLLDQRMNDRGVQVDLPLVDAAQAIVDVGITRANAKLDDLTNGDVTAISNNRRLLGWLNAAGAETGSISKAAVAALRERDDLSENVMQVLELRAEAGRSSVAKLKSFTEATCADGRARGLLLYHGASTGRWTGRLIQPQNFPRGEVKSVESYIPLVMAGEYDVIDAFHPPIVVVLSLLRGMLTAAPGHDLIAGDFSAIEARVLNWLAGQDDVVETFRKYDAAEKDDKPKFDPYRIMAVKMGRGTTPELVTKEDRQAGKAAELGFGYGMGEDKFVTAAWDVYQVRVTKAQGRDAKLVYRSSHDRVVDLWHGSERACIDAVRKPGTVQTFGGLKNLRATCRGGYLYVILPSGRPLCYAAPSVKDRETPWGEMKPSLHYWTVDSYTRQWGEIGAYGGLLVENIVQAVSRDLMAEAMLSLEHNGYTPVLSVHDEIVCEVPTGVGTIEDFESLMAGRPAWATGCPVAAEAWRGERYRK